MKKIILSLVLFFFLFSSPAWAHNRGLVLGEQSTAPTVPLTSGPGFLLPNSPFYFLDDWLDQLKLLVTFNPKNQINLRMSLAAERLAELQVLLADRNPQGLDVALARLTVHIDAAKQILKSEKLKGKDVSGLAHDLSAAINQEQEFLDYLTKISPAGQKLLFKNAQVQITEDEIEVEDELAEDEQKEEEIKELTESTKEELEEASAAAQRAAKLNQELQQRLREEKRQQLEQQTLLLEKTLEKQGQLIKQANEEAAKLQERLQEQTEIKKTKPKQDL